MHLSKRMLAFGLSLTLAVSSITAPAVTVEAAPDTNLDVEYNYAKLLQESLYFYDANMCGYLEDACALSWRGNCHAYDKNGQVTIDGVTYAVDASGGFHDAGDHVKFGLPQGYAASMLGMSYYEFPSAFTETKQDVHLQTITDYFCDYFKRCTIYAQGSDTVVGFVYQVGDGNSDHAVWSAPETQTLARPLYVATSANPATDEVSVAIAALAINYINFGAGGEPRYVQDLQVAKDLFAFVQKNDKGCASEGAWDFYASDSWQDDFALAAAALYKATGDTTYLDAYNANQGGINSYWVLDWANSGAMAAMLMENTSTLASIANVIQSKTKLDNVFNCLSDWGSCRYSASEQFVGLVYDRLTGTKQYDAWAISQMNYMIGDNPTKQCYMVGYNANSSQYPHHRAASGSTDANVVNPAHYTLLGALVGGPKTSGYYADDQGNYESNEVALDYNAGYVGALAGLYTAHKNDTAIYLSYAGKNTSNYSIALVGKEELAAVGVTRYYGDDSGSGTSGEGSDGDVSDNDISSGDVSDSDVSDGDVSDSDISSGDVSGSDVSDGDVSGSDVSSGDVSDGDVSGGDPQPVICLHVNTKEEKQNGRAATCTEGGTYDMVTVCLSCGKELARTHETTAALGHKWDAGQVVTEAGLQYDRVMRYTCERCGLTRDETLQDGLFHVLAIPDQDYTGKAIKPTVTVYDGSVLLRAGKDYMVSYKNNLAAGTAQALIKGKGNYKGSLTTTFRILPRDLAAEDVTVQAKGLTNADLEYGITLPVNGKLQQPALTVKWGKKTLKKGTDYVVEYPSAAKDAYRAEGTYEIRIRAKDGGNFTGERTIRLHLTKQALVPVSGLKCAVKAQNYTGSAITTAASQDLLTVRDGGKLLTEGTDYMLTYADNVYAGTARIILTGKPEAGYSGTRVVTFRIQGIAIGKATFDWLDGADFAYRGGDPVTPAFALSYGGTTLSDSSYSYTYENNTQVGTATLTLTGKGQFSGSIKKTFKVQPYDAASDSRKIMTIDPIAEQAYVKGGAKPKVSVRAAGVQLAEGVDYTLTYQNNQTVTTGEGTDRKPVVQIRFKGNYRNTITRNFVIQQGSLQTARMDAADKAESVKPSAWKQTTVALYDTDGKKLKAGTDYNKTFVYSYDPTGQELVRDTDAVQAGTTIYVTVTGAGNYAGSHITGSYRVVQTLLKAGRLKAVIPNQTYQTVASDLQAKDITVTYGGVKLVPEQEYVVEQTTQTSFLRVGKVTVTIRGKGVYGGTCKVKYLIVAKPFQ